MWGTFYIRIANKKVLLLQDERIRNIWGDAISQSLNELDCICEAHFCEEDIDSHFETKMPDGTFNRIKKGIIRLKPNAIPREVICFYLYRNTVANNMYTLKFIADWNV